MSLFENTSTNESSDDYDNKSSNVYDHYNDREIFKKKLAQCFVNNNNNISLKQSDEILKVFRTHECFSNLPQNCKTLIHTPHISININYFRTRTKNVFISILKIILNYFKHCFSCTTY